MSIVGASATLYAEHGLICTRWPVLGDVERLYLLYLFNLFKNCRNTADTCKSQRPDIPMLQLRVQTGCVRELHHLDFMHTAGDVHTHSLLCTQGNLCRYKGIMPPTWEVLVLNAVQHDPNYGGVHKRGSLLTQMPLDCIQLQCEPAELLSLCTYSMKMLVLPAPVLPWLSRCALSAGPSTTCHLRQPSMLVACTMCKVIMWRDMVLNENEGLWDMSDWDWRMVHQQTSMLACQVKFTGVQDISNMMLMNLMV